MNKGPCYHDEAEKRELWERETLPRIFACARQGAADLAQRQALTKWMAAHGVQTVAQLHEAARAGTYKPSPRHLRHCDPIQEVAITVRHGGDCDQWAAVLLACLRLMGFTHSFLVAVGDDADPYRHVCVTLQADGHLWRLDPKGDQRGAPFNVRADTFPLEQAFTFRD